MLRYPERRLRADVQIKALQRAAELKGGTESLAVHLAVSHATLLLWLQRKAAIPAKTFEKLLDLLLESDVVALGGAIPAEPARTSRILVVDDDAGGAYGLARILRQLGHEVETAADGPSALALARRFRPQVIFLDLRMPGMDGVELAQALRAEGLGAHFVAATAYAGELGRARERAARFDAHLLKPAEAGSVQKLLAELH